MAKIRCRAEPGEFPESEFRHDQNGSLHYPLIHERGNHHYINGTPVKPSPDPVAMRRIENLQTELNFLIQKDRYDPFTSQIRDLAEKLNKLALGLLEEDLNELIKHALERYKRYVRENEERGEE